MSKVSKTVKVGPIVAAASAAALLAGCGEDSVPTYGYQSTEECRAAGHFTQAACDEALMEARRRHAEEAPQYEDKQDCEDDFGEGRCGVSSQSMGQTTHYNPYLTYWLISRMGNGGYTATPAYSSRGGQFVTPGGATVNKDVFNRNGAQVRPSAVNSVSVRSVVPKGQSVSSRGGFGSRGFSAPSRGFGS